MYRSLCLLSILLVNWAITFSVNAQETPYITVDVRSGEVLSQYRPDHRWYPASLTKLMTAYVTFRAIQAGEIADGSPVEISTAATRQPPSRMGYKKGVRLRMDTALKIIIIKSANDVSLALAEAVAGDLKSFVGRMNYEAARLGMSNSRFVNSNGLHDSGQFTSARDMALLSARILTEFPQYAYMFEAVAIKTPVKTHYSYNLLLERFPHTTGMKTGFVCASGYNMVASANVGARHVVSVVLGRSSQTDRAVAAAKLLQESANSGGLGTIYGQRPTGALPKNMRPILCTKAAREGRYEPGAGQANIKSAYLNARTKSENILAINVGGVDAAPSDAWLSRKLAVKGKIPVPVKRPNFDPVSGQIKLVAIGVAKSGQIAVPTPRPDKS
ncbi:MAG: D-alanyl-D-alanine carboxypeptidase family protein [Pseudomonadota bacterium]